MVKSFSFKGVNVSGDVNSCVRLPTKSMNIEPTVEQWCFHSILLTVFCTLKPFIILKKKNTIQILQ